MKRLYLSGELHFEKLSSEVILTRTNIQTHLRVLVNLGFVLDILGAVSVTQSGDGFVIVVVRRTAVGTHHSLGIPPEGVLQQSDRADIWTLTS